MDEARGNAETKPDNVVLIGAKPPMNYVLAIVTQFHSGSQDVVLKARGRAISRCVDVAEIVRNRFMEGCTVENIQIATERVTNDQGRSTNVSSIEITLTRP